MNRKEITEHYKKNRKEIKSRLKQFSDLRESSDQRKFKELVFVILTSQTEAKAAWEAVKTLEKENKLFKGDKKQINPVLEEANVSYSMDKSKFIVDNREDLSQPTLADPERKLKINTRIDADDLESTRKWFVENIKGLSWKGSSHFLRNTGYGNGFAIISGHISTQMHNLGLTESLKPPQNRKQYMNQEKLLQEFSEDIGIDIKALDLVLWSMKTGEIFK